MVTARKLPNSRVHHLCVPSRSSYPCILFLIVFPHGLFFIYTVATGDRSFERVRAEWLKSKHSAGAKRVEIRGKAVDVEEVVESVFAQDSDGTLPQAMPLGQMVDILMDFWEADGFFE